MQINNHEDLISLAQRLVKDGPHSSETTPRRIRGLLSGTWAFDTIGAKYIWEHAYYPYFYIPRDDFIGDNLVLRGDKSKVPDASAFWLTSLRGGRDARTNRVIVFADDAPQGLEAFVRVEHAAIDWFVEDEKLLGPHPKDPYKRVECIPSWRTIRVEINGTKVAESSNNVFLFETLLRPRYYFDAAAIEYGSSTDSETVSSCPYKGTAKYVVSVYLCSALL